jgi:DNA polymerase elongation subunit (family B)
MAKKKQISNKKEKILVLDIETAPILVYGFGLFDQNHGLNQIVEDGFILCWAAKWLGEDKIMFAGQQKVKKVKGQYAAVSTNDKEIVEKLAKLIIEADAVVTQNGKRFDIPTINGRLMQVGSKIVIPKEVAHFDLLDVTRYRMKMTSTKLEYISSTINEKYKKLVKNVKFPGFEKHREIMLNNSDEAWDEMELYNKYDVLSTEEAYLKLRPWFKPSAVFSKPNYDIVCSCGSTHFIRQGTRFTEGRKYVRLQCTKCGSWHKGPLIKNE